MIVLFYGYRYEERSEVALYPIVLGEIGNGKWSDERGQHIGGLAVDASEESVLNLRYVEEINELINQEILDNQ